MAGEENNEVAIEGNFVQLLGGGYKSHFIQLKKGEVFQTHRGVISHDDIIGQKWGTCLHSHQGNPFYLMQPALGDVLKNLKRNTQIMYPKDIGYAIMVMGIGPGQVVLEAGTGSGALTCAFAFLVGDNGKVISYDRKAEIQDLAGKNLAKMGLNSRVIFKSRDVSEGFDERNVDAIFLDLPNPYDYIEQIKTALRPGGFFGSILPTMNQVALLLEKLNHANFAFIEVCEVLLRFYKTDWQRFRPTDRMVAHTGFLIFARSVIDFDQKIEVGDDNIENNEESDSD